MKRKFPRENLLHSDRRAGYSQNAELLLFVTALCHIYFLSTSEQKSYIRMKTSENASTRAIRSQVKTRSHWRRLTVYNESVIVQHSGGYETARDDDETGLTCLSPQHNITSTVTAPLMATWHKSIQ